MANPEKAAAVAELTERFRGSNAGVLTEYRGLSVSQLVELRRALGGNATYAVVKNTLTAIAAREAGVDAFDGRLTGPTAIAFVTGDPVEAAKGLRDFARKNPALVIKGGYLGGKALSPTQVTGLADLDSREVLLAKMAGALKASMSNAAALFAAPLSQAVRTVDALREKRQNEAPASGAATTDAPSETSGETAGAEADTTAAAEATTGDVTESPAEA